MLHVIRNLLLFLQLSVVAAGAPSPLADRAAFTSTGRPHHSHWKRSRCGVPFQLQVQTSRQKNPLMELVADVALGKTSSSGNIDSVEDFDADLAGEIQAALESAGVFGNDIIDGNTVDGTDVHDATNQNALDVSMGGGDMNTTTQRQIGQPAVEKKAPQNAPKMPPHTALAQVLANQYGIDIASIPPSSGRKITAEDVEFYAWKIAQPPCTAAALKLAYSLGLDLWELYEDDLGMELTLSEVQLYQENRQSLQMTSQTKKGKKSSGKKSKRTKALDEHLEQGIDKLSQRAKRLADTVAGGIVQQVKSQTQKIQSSATETLRVGEIFADTNGLTNCDITSVEDFDADLASAIQEALSSVELDVNGEGAADATSAEASSVSPAREVDVDVDVNDMANGDMVEDFDRADGKSKSEEEVPSTIPSRELLESMTCASLKDQLRARGLKVSGKKEELVSRLVNNMDDAAAAAADDAEDDDNKGGGSPLFFATLQ